MKTLQSMYGVALCAFLTLGCNKNEAQIMIGATEIDTLSVVTGLDTPWEILWGPDNYIWLTERQGKVSRLNPETGELNELLTIPDVHEQSESGLLGMVLHPNFPDSAYVYLVYNYNSDGIKEKVVRYKYNGSILDNPFTLIENIGGSTNHNGSRLVIDDNYKLFITTGEATNTSLAQNLSSLSGKILRMNLDGSIPADNPIEGSYIWSWGHRNPQGLVITPNGKMYSSEHGEDSDDEINLIEKGRNYGWPDVRGFCNTPDEITYCNNHNIKESMQAWTPTLAVAGIDFYTSDAIPEWKNCILMTSLKAHQFVSLKPSADGANITNTSTCFVDWFGRIRDVCVAPDGRVFIATSNKDGRGSPVAGDDRIVQIKAKNTPIGIQNIEQTDEITVFPNPASDQTIIKLNKTNPSGRIILSDLSGKVILEDTYSQSVYLLHLDNISPGYYFLEIISSTWKGTTSVIVL